VLQQQRLHRFWHHSLAAILNHEKKSI
jgi:hypothetical protein